MAFKHILVPLFGYDADRTALDAALTLAKRGGAHISARHIKVDPMESVPLMVDVGVAATELIEAVERHAATRGKAAAATFEAWRNERDLKIDDQPSLRTGITTAFKVEEGAEDELIIKYGRLTDLVVMGRPSGEEAGDQVLSRMEDALFGAGQPVLLVPNGLGQPALDKLVSGPALISWNGSIEATRAIAGDPALDGTRVLVLTTFEDDELVLEALRAGASGFLGKGVEAGTLVDAVRAVARGESLLSPTATIALIRGFREAPPAPAPVTGVALPLIVDLTAREREITALVARGQRPDAEKLTDLAARRYRGTVNLCAEMDGGDGPAIAAAGLSGVLRTRHVPVTDMEPPTVAQVTEILDLLSQPDAGLTYVHCEAGRARTGVVIACYRMAVMGWSVADALIEAVNFGCTVPGQQAFIREFGVLLLAGGPSAGRYPLLPPGSVTPAPAELTATLASVAALERNQVS